MEKRAKINLFFSIVAVMLLTFLFVPGQVRAEDQNVVQLDFTNCSEIDTDAGRVTYEIEGAKYRISLYRELDFEQMQRVAITSNGMEIDLNAFSYYLEVAAGRYAILLDSLREDVLYGYEQNQTGIWCGSACRWRRCAPRSRPESCLTHTVTHTGK